MGQGEPKEINWKNESKLQQSVSAWPGGERSSENATKCEQKCEWPADGPAEMVRQTTVRQDISEPNLHFKDKAWNVNVSWPQVSFPENVP